MNIELYHVHIRDWYATHARDLPWRSTRDAYFILVSEIMLQQTQVERVIVKLQEFMTAFPTIEALAKADSGDVLRQWKGLGYNSRALRLQKTAQAVLERFNGIIPHDEEELLSLPGIGAYTAGAIQCFAYEKPVSFADINVNRLIHRVFVGLEFTGWKRSPKELHELVRKVADTEHSYTYHQALMDLGSQVCKATKVFCETCPLQDICKARAEIHANPLIVQEKRVTYKKKKEVFKETKRFLRGKIVDYLREHESGGSREELFAYITGFYEKFDQEKAVEALADLLKEGVIKKEGKQYRI